MKGTVTIPGLGTITNLAFLARALETQIGANILSTPTLLTLDNEEARIIVGQNIPLVTGSYATTGNTHDGDAVPDVRAQGRRPRAARQAADHRRRHDPARALPGGVAHRQTLSTTTGIILSKRALESTVIVDDTQIIVLGGLIQDQLTDGSDKVPLLGDIPIAGALFRYDARQRAEDQPDDLHQADGAAHERRRSRPHVGALRVPEGEQERQAPPARLFWNDPTQPTLPREGVLPGTPGADPTPPLLGDRPPPPRRPEPAPPAAASALAAGASSPRWPPPRPPPQRAFAQRIPYAFARTHGVLALARGGRRGRRADAARRDGRGHRGAEARAAAAARDARRRRRALRRGARARLQRGGAPGSRSSPTTSRATPISRG